MRELERDHVDTRADLPALVIVGAGRMGTALAWAARNAGLAVALAGEDEAPGPDPPQIALLCVPDSSIEAACEQLLEELPGLRFIGHTSGATGLGPLSAAEEQGVETFSIHPLQSVPEGGSLTADAPAAISADSPAGLDLARDLATRIGLRPFELPEASRVAYHAAASMASNFLIALEESAADILAAAGLDEGRELLRPLVLQTAANWSERGAAALTGPIARGDTATVEAHRAALADLAPGLLPLYLALAERTREIATRSHSPSPERVG